MLANVRKNIIHTLWDRYRASSLAMQQVENGLKAHGLALPPLDHLAIVDLPGPHTGIHVLRELFLAIGFVSRGEGYLPDKQNDFHWMADSDANDQPAGEVLPQVVVGDFRLEEMPNDVRAIIEKYAALATPISLTHVQALAKRTKDGDTDAANTLTDTILQYLSGRDWPAPTISEFQTVHDFNELLAWVLIFSRCPNHFTLAMHLQTHFENLDHFHHFLTQELNIPLNQEGGIIKGNADSGIQQSSTAPNSNTVELQDGNVSLPGQFVEFVWRFPDPSKNTAPRLWQDYFTGFVAQHANHVIESLTLD